MGNITILDLIGAAVVSGFLLVMVSHSNGRLNETVFTTGADLAVQQHLVNVVEIVEADFRRIGYCREQGRIPDPSKAIVSAGKSSFSFLTDVESDGIVDTVSYFTAATPDAGATPNPRDKLLYRKVNDGKAVEMNIGLTRFDVKYFNVNNDSMSAPVANPALIHNMEISIQLESTHPYDNNYTYASWRLMRLKTRNLASR